MLRCLAAGRMILPRRHIWTDEFLRAQIGYLQRVLLVGFSPEKN